MRPDGTDRPLALRPPAQVMRLDRLGALHPCRLSFARQLTRRIEVEGWRITRDAFALDETGRGYATYTADTGARCYALIVFGTPDGCSAVLIDGTADADDIQRLGVAIRGSETGRMTERELCLLQARRAPALWDHAVARLAAGQQRDAAAIDRTGILMHCDGVHGAGRFGTADRDLIADRPELRAPYQVELLALALLRLFARDMVAHLARVAGGARAARLAPALACRLGLGLSAGLGLARFPILHPCLFNTWIMAREDAIARVAALTGVRPEDWHKVSALLARLAQAVTAAHVALPAQKTRNAALVTDLARLAVHMGGGPSGDRPWAGLLAWAGRNLGLDGQEALASAVMEPYGDLVDGLGHCMADTHDRDYRIDGGASIGRMRALIAATHGWALDLDWAQHDRTALAWTMTDDAIGPLLGPRANAQRDGATPFELPLAVTRDAVRAWATLGHYPAEDPMALMLRDHPQHRGAIRRAQISGFAPYGEIRDNLIGADLRPVDLLRATLSFIGATDFDPACDRRLCVRVFAGAPYPGDLRPETADPWIYPGAVA